MYYTSSGRRKLKLNPPKPKFTFLNFVVEQDKYTNLYICDNIDKVKNVPMTQIFSSKINNIHF